LSEGADKLGQVKNVALDGVGPDGATSEGAARSQVSSIHGNLEVAAYNTAVFEHDVIEEHQSESEFEVMDAAGTNRPSVLGRGMGASHALLYSMDERSDKKEGLGWKKSNGVNSPFDWYIC
jgi:hypothetical protein